MYTFQRHVYIVAIVGRYETTTISTVMYTVFSESLLSTVGVCLVECDPEVLGTSPSSQRSAGSVAVPNGMVTYNGVVFSSVATLACDIGYSVSNEYNRTCKGDGHWSQGTLRCEQETIAGESTKRGLLCMHNFLPG